MKNPDNAFPLTLRGSQDDALATVRTAVMVAKNLRTTLQLEVEGSDCFKAHFGSAASDHLLLGLLDSAKRQLSYLSSASGPEFAMEVRLLSDEAGFTLIVRSAGSTRCKESAQEGAPGSQGGFDG